MYKVHKKLILNFKKNGEKIRGKREAEQHWVLKYQFIVLTSFLCFWRFTFEENLALPISKIEMWFTVFMEAFVFWDFPITLAMFHFSYLCNEDSYQTLFHINKYPPSKDNYPSCVWMSFWQVLKDYPWWLL